VILFTVLGLVAQTAFGIHSGLFIGMLAGFVVANIVPAKNGGCAVRYRDDGSGDTPDP